MKSNIAVRAKFLRLGVKAKYTLLFEEMDKVDKNIISNHLKLLSEESIILVFYSDKSYWWALTNSRLIIESNSLTDYLILSEIEKIKMEEIFEGTSTKASYNTLTLVYHNENIKLRVEENTWYAIYNILKFTIN